MVYIILGNGFEETEATAPYDVLARGGVDVKFAGVGGKSITGGHGMKVTADCTVEEISISDAELIVVPGGLGGVDSILASSVTLETLKAAYNAGKKVAAICAGPRVLAETGILAEKNAVCYPGMEDLMIGAKMSQKTSTVVDGNVITGRGAGASLDFGLRLLEELRGSAAADKVAGAIHYVRS